MGYHRAGFDVVGVDIKPQPNYPFEFFQDDALKFVYTQGHRFDAIHASPPCQKHVTGLAAVNRILGRTNDHVDLIACTRLALLALCRPYVIENVESAPLINPVRLCGSSFGLPIRRHRLFESSVMLMAPQCEHDREREKKYWTSWVKNGERQRAAVVQVYGNGGEREHWGPALDIGWMTPDELSQAIPPAYTELIGRQLLAVVRQAAALRDADPHAASSPPNRVGGR